MVLVLVACRLGVADSCSQCRVLTWLISVLHPLSSGAGRGRALHGLYTPCCCCIFVEQWLAIAQLAKAGMATSASAAALGQLEMAAVRILAALVRPGLTSRIMAH